MWKCALKILHLQPLRHHLDQIPSLLLSCRAEWEQKAGRCASFSSATWSGAVPQLSRLKVLPRGESMWQTSWKPYSSTGVCIHSQLMSLDGRNDANRAQKNRMWALKRMPTYNLTAGRKNEGQKNFLYSNAKVFSNVVDEFERSWGYKQDIRTAWW